MFIWNDRQKISAMTTYPHCFCNFVLLLWKRKHFWLEFLWWTILVLQLGPNLQQKCKLQAQFHKNMSIIQVKKDVKEYDFDEKSRGNGWFSRSHPWVPWGRINCCSLRLRRYLAEPDPHSSLGNPVQFLDFSLNCLLKFYWKKNKRFQWKLIYD